MLPVDELTVIELLNPVEDPREARLREQAEKEKAEKAAARAAKRAAKKAAA